MTKLLKEPRRSSKDEQRIPGGRSGGVTGVSFRSPRLRQSLSTPVNEARDDREQREQLAEWLQIALRD